ncbi:MAG TPA: hypothetical protein VGM19_05550 [Armatimonadota bacterium]|jgi:hypothetical protein
MNKRMAILAMAVWLMIGWASTALAQDQGINLDFEDQPLGVALRALKQVYGLQYSIAPDLANKRVTVHQQVANVQEAVQELAKAAGIGVLVDPSGGVRFQAAGAAGTGTGTGQTAASPWAGTGTGSTVAQAPPAWRPGQGNVQPQVPGAAAGAAARPGQPGATGSALAPGQFQTPYGTVLNVQDLTLRVVDVTYIGPDLLAALFGGNAIYDQSSTGGGNRGTGNNSGFGNSGTSNNNSGTGSNRSNRSSGSGSNSSSGNRTY